MSLNTALAGIQAAQTGLNVASNNLANTSTTGFKAGSAEFSDIYPANTANAPGQGVTKQFIQQNYSQGNLTTTNNPLDLAIQGKGFFVTQKNGQQSYTRDGAFQLSPSGQLQNANGSAILGYGVNSSGKSTGIVGPLATSTASEPATATTRVSLGAALNSGASASSASFNEKDPSTYNNATSVVTYDSLGNPNHVQLYFKEQPASGSYGTTKPNQWSVWAQPQNANGSGVGSASKLTTLTFNNAGSLTSGGSASLAVNWNNGAAASNVKFSFTGTTLGAQQFAVNATKGNGNAPGTFTGTKIAKTGAVQAKYSNGQTKTVGQLALASFINDQGLIPTSKNLFQASQTSGKPVLNAPGTGVNGTLVASSLEQSNVQTSKELVNLITDQQAYQGNVSVLQGNKQDTAKLLQLG